MINKSLPQLCLMLPVCSILVFQLNWKHLSFVGTFDGTPYEIGGKGDNSLSVDLGSSKEKPSGLCTPSSLGRERSGS